MSHYQHLSIKERESIWENRIKGKTLSEIAAMIGRSIATVSRELKRNSRKGTYRPSEAQASYKKRRKKCRRPPHGGGFPSWNSSSVLSKAQNRPLQPCKGRFPPSAFYCTRLQALPTALHHVKPRSGG